MFILWEIKLIKVFIFEEYNIISNSKVLGEDWWIYKLKNYKNYKCSKISMFKNVYIVGNYASNYSELDW